MSSITKIDDAMKDAQRLVEYHEREMLRARAAVIGLLSMKAIETDKLGLTIDQTEDQKDDT